MQKELPGLACLIDPRSLERKTLGLCQPFELGKISFLETKKNKMKA